MKHRILLLFLMSYALSIPCSTIEAKDFDIDAPREVYIYRSAKAGYKMVKVVAYGRKANVAIGNAMRDAVASLTFFGAKGLGEMEGSPPILLDGRNAFVKNRILFNNFFKKKHYMSYVKRVNTDYPTGKDNVKTPKGRRIQIVLLVDWNGLAKFYEESGLKTITGTLSNY